LTTIETAAASPKKQQIASKSANLPVDNSRLTRGGNKRKQAKANLLGIVEKYQYLQKHSQTGICEISIDGSKFETVNDAICRFLGYSEKELLSMTPLDLLSPESRRIFQEKLMKAFIGKKALPPAVYNVKTKYGNDLWVLFNLKIVYANDKPASILIVASDVTERKKVEEKLVSTEKRYRKLYETTQDGIMARDLTGKMIDCNRAYAEMLGYTRKELKNLSVKDLLPEKWLDQREKVVSKVLKTGRSIVFEREYKRKDGSVFPASVRTWRLTDGKGKVIGVWSIVRDIGEQKQLQKDLEDYAGVLAKMVEERTKQLKDTERLVAIGQTAGMVGHDLRNPLQTLLGELYLAKSEVEGLGDGEAKDNLKESIRLIEEQVAYMDKIVSDLQAFVQPVKIDKKPIDLKQLLADVLDTVPVPSSISVKTECQEVFPAVKADAHLLKRVLINLVTNAVQAMPNGGNLTLKVANSPDQVTVSVVDTGVGIADKIKNQIFTPLFTTKPRGQGFGLAVCKRVIEAHGGCITFESTEGKGATFTIQFPTN